VHHNLLCRFTTPYGHQQRIQNELFGDGGLHGPAGHFTGIKIQHHSQIKPTLLGADIRDVRHPDLIWRIHSKFSVQGVRRQDGGTAMDCSEGPISPLSLDFVVVHDAGNTILAAPLTSSLQIRGVLHIPGHYPHASRGSRSAAVGLQSPDPTTAYAATHKNQLYSYPAPDTLWLRHVGADDG